MRLGRPQLEALWVHAGGSRASARTAAAIALAESAGNVGAAGDKGLGGKGATSFGLWQIHTPAHPQYDAAKLASDPLYNARAAVAISRNGRDFNPWTTYKTGAYRSATGAGGATGASGAPSGAGAPQAASGGVSRETLERIGQLEAELRGHTVPVQSIGVPLPDTIAHTAIAQGVAPQRQDDSLLSAVQALRAGLGGEGGGEGSGQRAHVHTSDEGEAPSTPEGTPASPPPRPGQHMVPPPVKVKLPHANVVLNAAKRVLEKSRGRPVSYGEFKQAVHSGEYGRVVGGARRAPAQQHRYQRP